MIDYNYVMKYTIQLDLDSGVEKTFIVAVQSDDGEVGIDGDIIMQSLLSVMQDPYGVFVWYDPDTGRGTVLKSNKVEKAHVHPETQPYEGVLVLPGLTDFI